MNEYFFLFLFFCFSLIGGKTYEDHFDYDSNKEKAVAFGKLKERKALLDSLPLYMQGEGIYEPPIDIIGYSSSEDYFDQNVFNGKYTYYAAGYDFPVGKPNGRGYYIAQKFQQSGHLGDDFNANTGGNSDIGHPIYATANGVVSFSKDIGGGWGKTIRIVHKNMDKTYTESLYSHCDQIFVKYGQFVKKGEKIGTIGTANGKYMAHLHFEIRDKINMPLGRGYSDDPSGYVAPTPYIRKNRPRW